MGQVKSQGHIVDPVSNQYIFFLFNVNRTNHHSRDVVFDIEKKNLPNFENKSPNKKFPKKFLRNLIR